MNCELLLTGGGSSQFFFVLNIYRTVLCVRNKKQEYDAVIDHASDYLSQISLTSVSSTLFFID